MRPRRLGNGRRRSKARRVAMAAVELVLLLPMLSFVCLVTIDYGRLFRAWAILADCARNGAFYASDSTLASSTGFTSISQAALADAGDLSPAPTISSSTGVDASGNSYIEVTATYQFTTLANYGVVPGFSAIPNTVSLSRKLRMVVTP